MKRNKEFIEQLLKEYYEGASMKELDLKYHTDTYYQFKKIKNIQKRKPNEQRTISRTNCYKLKWNCSAISNEFEAYILGMLYADGYITDCQLGLKLKKSDKELVEIIKNYFSEDIKLQFEKNNYKFVVSSVVVVNNLKKIGLSKHKTNFNFNIPILKSDLYKHFIRGYFDGDGSIYICKKNIKTPFLKGYICSPTEPILKDIQNILLQNNIDCKINIEKRIGKTIKCIDKQLIASCDMYRLFIRKKEALSNFYHFLYDDCNIFLKRKKEIFDNYFNINNIHVNTEIN